MRFCLPFPVLLLALLAMERWAWARQGEGSPQSVEQRDALSLYEAGVRRYNLADYDQAIDLFKRAYLLSEAPELLFNVAQAYRLKGDGFCALALRFYRNYLRLDPKTAKRAS